MVERLTVRQAGTRLGVSPTTVRRMIAVGELQAEREIRPQGARWIVLFSTERDAPAHEPNRASGTSLVTNAVVSDLRERVAFLEQLTAQQANQISALIRRLPELSALITTPSGADHDLDHGGADQHDRDHDDRAVQTPSETLRAILPEASETPASTPARRGWLARLLGR